MPPPDRTTARRGGPIYLVAALIVVLAVGTLGGTSTAAGSQPAALASQPVQADSVLLSVAIQPDGAARWRVEYRTRLDDDNATRAFEALQADIRANRSTYVDRFSSRMSSTVVDAASLTGRPMALRNVSVTARQEQLPQRYGVLAYTFEWTGFAVVDAHRLRAGDAMAGLFLDDQTTLLVSWPSGYRVASVSPAPTTLREDSVVWRGPMDFGPGEPALVVSSGGGGDTSLLGLAVVAVVLVAGGGLVWWRRRDGGWPGRGTAGGREGHVEPSASPASDQATRDAGSSGDATASRSPAEPPPELLSNEERVLALLHERGGRMKQQAVVEALGWTDAKTSQVVGKLRDAGQVEGFRLGRENVLRLPEDGPLGAPSDRGRPSDDEDGGETDAADPGGA